MPRIRRLGLWITAISLCACGGGGGGGGGETPPPSTAHTLSGSVVAGATSGAQVQLFAASGLGAASGAALASTTSGADGSFTIALTTLPSGPLVLVASGGSYASEIDASPQAGGSLRALLPALTGTASSAHITPLSTLVSARASTLLSAGTASLASALASATTELEARLGPLALGGGAVSSVAPSFAAAASGAAREISIRLGVLEQLARNLGVAPADLVAALARDLSDGTADGRDATGAVPLGSSALPGDSATSRLAGAAHDYARQAGSVHAQAGIDSRGAAAAIGDLLVSTQAASAAGSSGAVAALKVTVAGVERQQVYFAARSDGLVRLDVTGADPATWSADALPALNTAIRTAGLVNAGLGAVGGVVALPFPVEGKPALLVYDPGATRVVLVDAAAATVIASATVTVSASTSIDAQATRIAGAAADARRGWIWLATADGLVALDARTLVEQARIAQPAGTQVAANLAVDVLNDMAIAPSPDGQGVVVFNLANRRAYVLDAAGWSALAGNQVRLDAGGNVLACAAAEVTASLCSLALDRPRSAAADAGYRVTVVANAGTVLGNAHLGLLRYSTPASTSSSAFAPAGYLRWSLPAGVGALSAVSLEPQGHYLFGADGAAGGNLVVAQLADPSGASWAGLSSLKAAANAAYPGAGLSAQPLGSLRVNGKSWGYALRGAVSGARAYSLLAVDLAAFLAAPADGNGVLTADPLGNTAIVRAFGY